MLRMAVLFEQLHEKRWVLLSIALLFYVANKYRAYRRLRAFNGPFLAGWCGVWHICALLSLRSHQWYAEACEKYGPIIRLGPNELMTTSSDLLTHMSAVRSSYTRAAWFYGASRVEPGKDHVFSQLDEAKHTKRRQQMAAGYSGKENTFLESSIDKHVQELLNLIRSKYLSTKEQARPMDLARKIQFFTLDVISSIGFGQPFGDLNSDSDIDSYIHSSEQGLRFVTFSTSTGLISVLHWPWIARLLGPSEKDKTGFGKMMATARRLIDSRLTQSKGIGERSDMLASFLRHGLSRDDLFTESILQILAGSDTTATAIRCTMLYLISHPRVYAKLQTEVDEYVASSTVMNIVPDAEAKKLRYLMAVIHEGLRIHPPVTDEVPKVVPEGGDTVIVEGKEVFLPGGINIGYCVLGLNRNREIFGKDVEQFRPERWLTEDEERLNAMKKTTDLIFGYGKYQCLGKPIAWLEISKVIFEFIRHLDWAISKPEKPWRERNFMGVFVHDEMWVQVTERKPELPSLMYVM